MMANEYLGLIGVVVGAVITGGKEVLFASGNRRRNARYLAIRVVCLLDRFAEQSAAVVADDGTAYGQPAGGDGCYQAQVATPEFPINIIDADWKAIPQEMMYALLSFPMLVEAADHQISGVAEHSSPPDDDVIEERQFQYARLGLKAASLAKQLRGRYNIPSRDFEYWNPIQFMSEKLGMLEKARNEARKRPSLLEELEADTNDPGGH